MTRLLHYPPLVVVGSAVCGKGSTVKYFVDCGYHAIDTGQLIRDEMAERGNLRASREEMHYYAGARRREMGGGHFIKQGMRRTSGPYLLDGLRSVAEIEAALELGFIVIEVRATEEQCFGFAQARGLPHDLTNRAAFAAMHRRDRGYVQNGVGDWIGHGDRFLPATDWVVRRAQAIIHNDGNGKDLRRSAVECLAAIRAGQVGPGLVRPQFSLALREQQQVTAASLAA